MPQKIHALVPAERDKECAHALGFAPTGRMGANGRIVRCPLCAEERQDD